jgi:hypothetical protein
MAIGLMILYLTTALARLLGPFSLGFLMLYYALPIVITTAGLGAMVITLFKRPVLIIQAPEDSNRMNNKED